MIELPEAVTLARQMEEAYKGKIIREIIALHSPHGFAFCNMESAGYTALLGGKPLDWVRNNAGQVELAAGEGRLVFNDGVVFKMLAPGQAAPVKHQFLLWFEDGSGFACTVQMYAGMLAFVEGTHENPYYLVAKQKPSPLSDGFTKAHFDGIVAEAKPNLSAKGLLATEQRIPGLGNGCLQDILFRAGVNPQSKLGALEQSDIDALYSNTVETLRMMTESGGRSTEKDLYGNPGGYHGILTAKTYGLPCPVCGGEIIRKAYMGGNVYYCPACQPVKK